VNFFVLELGERNGSASLLRFGLVPYDSLQPTNTFDSPLRKRLICVTPIKYSEIATAKVTTFQSRRAEE
jgi:hypothetical protein